MNKRGQITIFIILAILIIAGVSIYFVLREGKSSSDIPSEIEPIYVQILSCLEETSKNGIEHNSLHGGYYEIPEAISIEYFSDNIPYYYWNLEKHLPSLERIEIELGNYVYDYLKNCIDFEEFEEKGYKISERQLVVFPEIKEKEVNIYLKYPLTIKKGISIKRLEKFEISLESEIKKFLSISEEIVKSYSENPGVICFSCLDEIAEKNGVQIDAAPFSSSNEDSILFLITSYETKLNWKFAVKI